MPKPSPKLSSHLVCFASGPLAVEADGPLPVEILICPWGARRTRKGVICCDATTEAVLAVNNRTAKRFPRIALDFEHNTVPGAGAYHGEPAMVAAWGDLDIRPGEGLYLSAVEWTPEGETHVRGGHAKGVSPALRLNDEGSVIFVHSAGLCRHQEIDGLTLFAADDLGPLITTANQNTTNDMDLAAALKLCNVFLGSAGLSLIPDTATVEDVERLAGEGADKIKAAMTGAKKDDPQTFSAEIMVLRESIETIKADNLRLQKDRIMDAAIRDGKVVAFTAAEIDAMDVKTFSAHVAALEPGKVPMESRATEAVKTFSAAEFNAVHRRMGLTKEDLEKYAPKN